MPFPVYVEKNSEVKDAVSFKRTLSAMLPPAVNRMIINYKNVRNPKPGVLYATRSASDQKMLLDNIVSTCGDIMAEGESLVAYALGRANSLALVARGVPVDIEEDALTSNNLGLIQTDTIKRLRLKNDCGTFVPGTTVFLSATSEDSMQLLISGGLKMGDGLICTNVTKKISLPPVCFTCGHSGHVSSSCNSEIAKDLPLDENGRKVIHCFKCQQTGHKHSECKDEDAVPRCPNCNQDGDHWPWETRCPVRHKQLDKSRTVTYASAAASQSSKDIQQLKNRVKRNETRLDAAEKKDEQQAHALHDTRLVIADVAMVQAGRKESVSERTVQRIADWYEFEKLKNSQRENEAKSSSKKRRNKGPKRIRQSSSLARLSLPGESTPEVSASEDEKMNEG